MAKNTLDETRALKVLLAQVRGFCESIQDILHNQDAAEIGRYSSFRDRPTHIMIWLKRHEFYYEYHLCFIHLM